MFFFPPSEPDRPVGSIPFIQSDRCCSSLSSSTVSSQAPRLFVSSSTGSGTGGNLAAVHLHQCSSLHLQAFFPPRRRRLKLRETFLAALAVLPLLLPLIENTFFSSFPPPSEPTCQQSGEGGVSRRLADIFVFFTN